VTEEQADALPPVASVVFRIEVVALDRNRRFDPCSCDEGRHMRLWRSDLLRTVSIEVDGYAK
jgi:hypothetical protein